MDPAADASQPIKIGLLLAANASLMSLCMIADALRLANREAGQTLYVWQVMSLTTGEAATDAQLQISIQPLEGEDLSQLDQLIIVGSDHYQSEIDLQLAAYLREKAPPSMVIGGVGAGVRVMAHAGLLDGYACAVPLESHFKFRSLYALARSQRSLYCFDGCRYSSLGGAAVLDMILELLW
jgi:transcriptional regulator GlxA family with amidase domain